MVRSAMTSRWPTCLACLRRLAQPSTSPLDHATGPVLVQTRAGSNYTRPHDRGVIVRLLEDVPKFGRKYAVFRTERGRMRNQWYPANKAEYMTRQRLKELGLTEEDVGERDRAYGVVTQMDEVEEQEVFPTPAPSPKDSGHVIAEVARSLLSTLVPETLTFHRKPIPKQAPKPSESATPSRPRISPLVASAESAMGITTEDISPEASEQDTSALGIYGSVSTLDIVNHIKEFLVADAEASLIALGPENIRIMGVEENGYRLKTLGRWEVEISVGAWNINTEPVRKMVEILPPTENHEDPSHV